MLTSLLSFRHPLQNLRRVGASQPVFFPLESKENRIAVPPIAILQLGQIFPVRLMAVRRLMSALWTSKCCSRKRSLNSRGRRLARLARSKPRPEEHEGPERPSRLLG